jgi:hypothetical protein
MHHFSPRQVIIGLTVLWLLALLAEGALLIDDRIDDRAAQRELTKKRCEADRLAGLDPLPTAAQAARIEGELTAAKDLLARSWEEAEKDSSSPGQRDDQSRTTGVLLNGVRAGGDLIRDLGERARYSGVSVRPDEQFGLSTRGHETGVPAADARDRRRWEATDCLVGALLAAHPAQLIAVQGARSRDAAAYGASARHVREGGEADELFDFEPCLSVGEPGLIETVPLRLTFTGRTATLRQFLNRLSTGGKLVAIDEISVEPIPTAGLLHRGKSVGGETVVLAVQPALSRFVVTAEFCELVAPPGAQGAKSRTAVASDARKLQPIWGDSEPQTRGRGWIFEVFTPPAIFCDRRGRELAAVPSEEAVLADQESAPLDLQLMRVRRKPFRFRLVGFAGDAKDLRGIFADTSTGKTVIAREGDRLAGHRATLKHLGLERADSGARGACGLMATAMIFDEGTGEEIILNTRGPALAGSPWGVFGSRKNPTWRRELKEGESVTLDGMRYRVGRIELEPGLAVVTCASADGAAEVGHPHILQITPDSPRGTPALTAAGHASRGGIASP